MSAELGAETDAVALSPLAAAVQTGDLDRFQASLFAPEREREALFALYAFNLEIARTPWRVSEPSLGAIRLRWWMDVVEEIYAGRPPRAHEIVEPLTALLQSHAAPPPKAWVEGLIDARLRDLDPAPMASRAELDRYLDDTSSGLMRLAVWVLADGEMTPTLDEAARDAGYAFGVANVLRATPALAARGRMMLPPLSESAPIDLAAVGRGETPDGLKASVHDLARKAADRLRLARRLRAALPAASRPAFLSGWRADAVLAAAQRADLDVFRDLGDESEFRRRAGLLWRGWTGRW